MKLCRPFASSVSSAVKTDSDHKIRQNQNHSKREWIGEDLEIETDGHGLMKTLTDFQFSIYMGENECLT
ncbi:hypothetical protein QUF72_02175 [Desulfobacterales bacterium HSG2]|nr:hypothetical protein [Desulfobacterales bacterium HSG2]